jgi:hypothetical protein
MYHHGHVHPAHTSAAASAAAAIGSPSPGEAWHEVSTRRGGAIQGGFSTSSYHGAAESGMVHYNSHAGHAAAHTAAGMFHAPHAMMGPPPAAAAAPSSGGFYPQAGYTVRAPTEPTVTVPMSLLDATAPGVFIPYIHMTMDEAKIAAALESTWGRVRSVTFRPRGPQQKQPPSSFYSRGAHGPPSSPLSRKAYVQMEGWYGTQAAQEARFHLLSGAFVKLHLDPTGRESHFLGCLMNRSAPAAGTAAAPSFSAGRFSPSSPAAPSFVVSAAPAAAVACGSGAHPWASGPSPAPRSGKANEAAWTRGVAAPTPAPAQALPFVIKAKEEEEGQEQEQHTPAADFIEVPPASEEQEEQEEDEQQREEERYGAGEEDASEAPRRG